MLFNNNIMSGGMYFSNRFDLMIALRIISQYFAICLPYLMKNLNTLTVDPKYFSPFNTKSPASGISDNSEKIALM